MEYHKPVLLRESVAHLVQNPDGVYVDGTFGGGGHSAEILNHLSAQGRLYAFDQDAAAHQNRIEDDRFQLFMQNFRYLKNQLKFSKVDQIDGLLLDLGVSSHQFDTAERGFSIRFEGPLDMRMNSSANKSAKEVVNEYEEAHLARIFRDYGELPRARKWAAILVNARKEKVIETTQQLIAVFEKYVSPKQRNKFFAQMFQALRIEVNDELAALIEVLEQSVEMIKPDGRLVVISYHSLEDRLVKRFIKNGMIEGEPERDVYGNWYAPFRPLQSKVIVAPEEEINENSRARSAKLRIGIKNHAQKKG